MAIRNASLAIPVALITWRAHLRKVRISPRAVRGRAEKRFMSKRLKGVKKS